MRMILAALVLFGVTWGLYQASRPLGGKSLVRSAAGALFDAAIEPGARVPSPARGERTQPGSSPPARETIESLAGDASKSPRRGKKLYYQFTDERGVVRFVERLDQVPEALRARVGRIEVESGPSSGGRVSSATRRRGPRPFADTPPPEPRVVLYTTAWCGWCRKTLAHLDDKRIRYVNKDIEANPAHRRELIEKTGRATIPVIEINGEIVNGYDPRRIDQLLASAS